jgi:hypothetical protein
MPSMDLVEGVLDAVASSAGGRVLSIYPARGDKAACRALEVSAIVRSIPTPEVATAGLGEQWCVIVSLMDPSGGGEEVPC